MSEMLWRSRTTRPSNAETSPTVCPTGMWTELCMSDGWTQPQNVDERRTWTQAVKPCHFKSKFNKFVSRTVHSDLNKQNIHNAVPKLSEFALFNCVNLNDVKLYAICVRREKGRLAGCQRCHILTDRNPRKKKTFRIKWEFMLAMLMRYGDNKKANSACTKQHTIGIKLMLATSHHMPSGTAVLGEYLNFCVKLLTR